MDLVAIVVIDIGVVGSVFGVSNDEVTCYCFASVEGVFVFRNHIFPVFAARVIDVGAHDFVFRRIVVGEEIEIVANFFEEILFVFIVVCDESEVAIRVF